MLSIFPDLLSKKESPMSSINPSPALDPTVPSKIGLSLKEGVSGKVCIPNINDAERRKRLTFGIISFVVALVILGALMVAGVDRLWRLPLFLVFAMAANGYFQWRDKTCVGLVATNMRKIGDSYEKVEDTAELAQLKYQARQVQLKAVVAAIPLTVIALVLPVLG
jgi:hypothetical protein